VVNRADSKIGRFVRFEASAVESRIASNSGRTERERANTVETDLVRGEWINPRRRRETFDGWADKWIATIVERKPKTRESYESIVSPICCPIRACRDRGDRPPDGAVRCSSS
jgi:hypothetical protein